LKTLGLRSEFTAYVSAPARPVVVLNQESLGRWPGQMPPGLRVRDTAFVGKETMRVIRLAPAQPPS